ncbi:TPA: RelA/SpoT domain-containing protein [Yersinia enterocolitica]|uniref:RelA/SpoT domain-containing protein n=1 Tax=Yersinia enterocolitica TaxID=630 RepID=UPI0028DF7340|nr:GTP pyrophosphokinase [Yersinia enterocolitica]EKN5072168.1 GTP pyrophosphokinase [Yersinia enterocolitica]HDZ9831783.1 GTP pyrophosphokinase [Yersinia enterocolitica]HEC1639379.1 GTP pyrophosphokinase [Yersinia enterocolitica]HEN3296353.1 GTP pyrophosphokinase [Yersinia enterocolitica]
MEIKDEDSYFLQEWSLDSELVEKSGLSVDSLRLIVQDYQKNQLTLLDEAEYIAKKIQRCNSVHSVRWRIKNTSHLLNKIIRKLTEDEPSEKYKGINSGNYKSIITDLIGVRAIYLFKSDWKEVHEHILSRWTTKKDESVMIYHRDGDIMDIYAGYSECKQEIHKHNYRSIHYVVPATNIESVQVYCEIQTRTIFEEGWSEIDHQVRYPDYSDDENLMSYLTIFNRLAGSADEMGSYVNELVELIKKNNKLESERDSKDKTFYYEKERLEEEIKSLSANQSSFTDMKNAYDKLIEVQNEELISLKEELKSRTDEKIKLNRQKIPVSKVISQNDTLKTDDRHEGTINIKVIRSNDFASFAGHFTPALKTIPNVCVTPIETTAKNTEISDLRVNTGVGNTRDFNAHVFNDKLKYIEEGEYLFSFVANLNESNSPT